MATPPAFVIGVDAQRDYRFAVPGDERPTPLDPGDTVQVNDVSVPMWGRPDPGAEIVRVFGPGATLRVVEAPVGVIRSHLVPVIDPGTGQMGYVGDEFLDLVSSASSAGPTPD